MKDEQFVNEVRNILAGKFSEIPSRDRGIIIEIGKILFEMKHERPFFKILIDDNTTKDNVLQDICRSYKIIIPEYKEKIESKRKSTMIDTPIEDLRLLVMYDDVEKYLKQNPDLL